MKKTLPELFDGCGPEELDGLLPDELDTSLPEGALERIEEKALEKAFPGKKRARGHMWLRMAVAACLVLAVGLAGVAYAAEAREYGAAVRFFDENGLSMEGLSREDVKAVYRDITTQRFAYDKTAEVIEHSVAGLEIFQREPTSEELAELWNWRVLNSGVPKSGVSYRHYTEEDLDETSEGISGSLTSYLERYEDGRLVWTAEFTRFSVDDYAPVSGGVVVWGNNYLRSSKYGQWAWLAMVDDAGEVLWEKPLPHGFGDEYIAAVVDNGDGTWAVISRGDYKYLCLSQFSESGKQLDFHKIEVGNWGIWNAARLEDGYLIQLGSYTEGEYARLVKMDREGELTDSFTYEGEDCNYYLKDMLEFNGRVYLSAYATPKLTDEGGRHEIAGILDYVFSKGVWEIPGEELTPIVRDNYTAVLLVCDSEGGVPETFYSIKGSLGAGLSTSGEGELIWEVESVANTFFSPATNAFTIGGTSQVFRYTFDGLGTLIRQEDTGETVGYYR